MSKRKTEDESKFSVQKRLNSVEKQIEDNCQSEIICDYNLDDLIVYSPISDSYGIENGDYEDFEENGHEVDTLNTAITTIQNDNCHNTSTMIPQCRECLLDPLECSKYTCRFYEFRKIEKDNLIIKAIGFLDKHLDPNYNDMQLFTMPDERIHLSSECTNYILRFVASQFCEMANEEEQIFKLYSKNNEHNVVAWKRAVFLVRETCDVSLIINLIN
jgi:hypothetical protein